MDWRHLRAHITGSVDEELLLRNEYLVAENQKSDGAYIGWLVVEYACGEYNMRGRSGAGGRLR